MNEAFALKILKRLVEEDKFIIINRRAQHAHPVSNEVAKIIVKQLSLEDFIGKSEDRDRPGEFLWIYKTDVGIKYYLKCKFSSELDMVKFISFHIAVY
ncbi:type II toxin-antitoxin system MqsR family toxin [uncultured Lactobacillus sp.]|uniref:type II toxin-antitoxin system MqsR family toxin n=1 Tax=uncultured Lactobacillus sp. TaxID=153152 RepID=UPI0026338960|nr:type II toxin-antitoxin system MqsR family toxin [uncultured Lactobacillus sp.]